MLSFLFFKLKAQQYFESLSYTFLYKKTLLKIWLKPGLNLTIFRGTRPELLGTSLGNDSYEGIITYLHHCFAPSVLQLGF